MVRLIYKFFFWFSGWKISGIISSDVKKYVMIVAPHTSNWDFLVGLAARSILKLDTKYLAKKELFKPPFGWLFYALGGYPVDRSKHNNLTDAVVNIFNSKHRFSICITPEGTRKYSEKWKTGFHSIAQKANVPVIMVAFDYSTKTVFVEQPFYPTADLNADIERIKNYYRKFKGKIPEYGVK
jgi:1-acyl-sn-glycerol-3-phosphate acyltransferase